MLLYNVVAQNVRGAVLLAILSLSCRGPTSAQIADLARNVSKAQLQRWQLIEVGEAVLAGIALAAPLEQVIEVRGSACTRVCLCQRSTLLLLRGLLRRCGTEEGRCTESSRLCEVRGLVCGRRLLRCASEAAAKEAARLRRWLRCCSAAEKTSCRHR